MYYPTYSSNDYIEFYKTGSAASWTHVTMQAAGSDNLDIFLSHRLTQ